MKKYFITGTLALVVGGFLVSCHDDEGMYGSLVEQKLQTYEQVFKQEFGEINPYQDWGFGISSSTTRTRAVSYTLTDHDPSNPTAPAQPTFSSEIAMPTQYKNTLQEAMTIEGIELLSNGYTAGGTYYVDAQHWNNSNPNAVDIQNSALTIYFDGNITFYGNNEQNNGTVFCVTSNSTLTLQKVRNSLVVYLAPGATLDLTHCLDDSGNHTDLATFQNTNSGIYLNAGSKVKAIDIQFVGGSKIRNEGTIEADNLTLNGQNQVNSSLWNNGQLKIKETLTLFNQDGELINCNKVTAQTLDMDAGGKFLNKEDGTVLIKGTSSLTNLNSLWQNKGEYTSGDFIIENTRQVYNNCKLTVTDSGTDGTGNFHLYTNSAFVLDGNASVKTKTMDWGDDSDFYMKDNSMLWVEGKLTALNNDKSYGARGLGTGYSIIKAGSIGLAPGDNGGQSRMNYFGKIYVDTDTHFDQGFDDQKGENEAYDQPYYYYSTNNKTVMFKFLGDPNPITSSIPAGKCHHGYNTDGGEPDTQTIPIITPTDGETTNTTITYWNKIEYKTSGRVFCEDLGVVSGSDIDFNDIVFDAYIYEMTPIKRVVTEVNGEESVEEFIDGDVSNFAEVYLLAAGGTLEVSVGEINVKNAFGVGKTTMVNTIDETVKDDGSVSTYGNNYVIGGADVVYLGRLPYSRIIDIPVYVTYNTPYKTALELQAYQGAAPHKICVPIGTRWPFERIEINEAYKAFNDYVKSPGRLGQVTGPVDIEHGDYSNDESGNSCWTDNSKIEETNLYRNLPYNAPPTGKFYEESDKVGSSDSNTEKQGGYDGEPVLVRRRH